VICDICEMATVLDPPSATELISMVPPEQRGDPIGQPMAQIQQHQTQPAPSRRSENINRSMRPERESCPEHPEEEVNYFCFECMSQPICSECVVHGIHKNHDVATIKKAYPQIMANIDDL
jgi:hypothetical protein